MRGDERSDLLSLVLPSPRQKAADLARRCRRHIDRTTPRGTARSQQSTTRPAQMEQTQSSISPHERDSTSDFSSSWARKKSPRYRRLLAHERAEKLTSHQRR